MLPHSAGLSSGFAQAGRPGGTPGISLSPQQAKQTLLSIWECQQLLVALPVVYQQTSEPLLPRSLLLILQMVLWKLIFVSRGCKARLPGWLLGAAAGIRGRRRQVVSSSLCSIAIAAISGLSPLFPSAIFWKSSLGSSCDLNLLHHKAPLKS